MRCGTHFGRQYSETNNAENILNDEQKMKTFRDKSSNAFMKGFAVLGGLFLALIPFGQYF